MLRIVCGFFVMLGCVSVYAVDETAIKVKWGYTGNVGPARWSQLDSDFAVCSSGKLQSPINIIKKVTKNGDLSLSFDYQPANLNIALDGNIELSFPDNQQLMLSEHGVQVVFPAGKITESIALNQERFRLVQFHFHSPSENRLLGQSFPLEIHFVHQGDKGHIAVIGVFVRGGAENLEIQKLINHFPTDRGQEHIIEGVQIDPMALIPDARQYYYFAGSLTTPPCTEGVNWVMMESPITASPGQIALIRKAAGGTNARPVQPLNGRKLIYVGNIK